MKHERETESDVERHRERGKERKREKKNKRWDQRQVFVTNWLRSLRWLAGQGEGRRVFSTSRGCLREREEREFAGTGGGGEGSHPQGTPSFQVEFLALVKILGQGFQSEFATFFCVFFCFEGQGHQQEFSKSRNLLRLDRFPLPHPRFQH